MYLMLIVLLGNCGNWNIFIEKVWNQQRNHLLLHLGGKQVRTHSLPKIKCSISSTCESKHLGPRWQEGTMMDFSTQSVWLSGENLQNAKSESDSIALLTNLCSIADIFPSTRQDSTLVKIFNAKQKSQFLKLNPGEHPCVFHRPSCDATEGLDS